MLRQREMRRVLDGLSAAGVSPLILKGTALAYGLYAAPELRPRADTDLFLAASDVDAAVGALRSLGYSTDESESTRLISTQDNWTFVSPLGTVHTLDVHRRINNSPLLAQSFGFESLKRRAASVPTLGPHALGLSDEDALLLACVHRAMHVDTPYRIDEDVHNDGDRLIWYYDMHLLLSRMHEDTLRGFAALAHSSRLSAICREALEHCFVYFPTPAGATVMSALTANCVPEPSAIYLSGTKLQRAWQDWRALPTWAEKAVWAWELALPSAVHMRRKYPRSSRTPLLLLYVRRAWRGAERWLR
jgi:hypothetical protein